MGDYRSRESDGEPESRVDQLLSELINCWSCWETKAPYYLNELPLKLIIGDPSVRPTSKEQRILKELRLELSEAEWQRLPDLIKAARERQQRDEEREHLRRETERAHKEQEREKERIRREAERARELQEREGERLCREMEQRERARKKDLLLELKKRFEDDFLGTDESFKSSCKHWISDEEYNQEKISFVQDWIRLHTGEAPDVEQASAIATTGCHIQVVARAGSGKTLTLINRALFLQKHCGLQPGEMLLVAFNKSVADEIAEKLSNMLDGPVPHVMTFHALAYAIVRPEALLRDGSSDENQDLSRAVQNVIDDHLQLPKFKEQVRELMLAHFREDWERITVGHYDRSREEFLQFRRSLPREGLRGEYLKSFGEKVIADFLFEHDIPYLYERNWWWSNINYRPDFTVFKSKDSGVVIEYFGLAGDPDYDEMSQEKRNYWRSKKPQWSLLEFDPDDITRGGVEGFREQLKTLLEKKEITCNRLSDDEIWYRIRGRAIDRFTKVCVGFIRRCRKHCLTHEELGHLIGRHVPLSSVEGMFLQIAQRLYAKYLELLHATGDEDFDGLMQRAAELINNGHTVFERKTGRGDLRTLRYIFIDEYQDFSELFHRLVEAIRAQNPNAEFFCVGDDWQAINGFAGSDLKFYEGFAGYFKPSRRLYISTNYRSLAAIVELGNALMDGRGKPAVVHEKGTGKVLLADLSEFKPSFLEEEDHPGDIITPVILRLTGKALAIGHNVVLLCRRNDLPWFVYSQAQRNGLEEYQDLVRSYFSESRENRIDVSTTHKYKGRQKQMVVVLDAIARSYPLIHPDWVFARVLGESMEEITEEERRLFYVALTRAVETLVIVTEKGSYSPFLEDLGRRSSLSKIDWTEFPPVLGSRSRFVVKVCNQKGRDVKPTLKIKDLLKAEGFRWQTTGKPGWVKSFAVDGFSIETLKRSTWAGGADGIEILIAKDYDSPIAHYLVNDGQWHCISNRLEPDETR